MDFRRQFPDIGVRIVEGTYSRHLAGMRDGTLDFALAVCPLEGVGAEFQQEELFVSELAIVTRRDSPWQRARSLADLQQAEWLMLGPATYGQGAAVIEAFTRTGLQPPRSRVICESLGTLQALLCESDVVCVLPGDLLGKEPFVRTVVRIPVQDALPSYAVSMIQRAQLPLKPTAAKLATLVMRHAHYFRTAAGRPAAD
jgi:DNA-binding transcriptional LysR family regulator